MKWMRVDQSCMKAACFYMAASVPITILSSCYPKSAEGYKEIFEFLVNNASQFECGQICTSSYARLITLSISYLFSRR